MCLRTYVRTCLLYNDHVHPVGSYVRMYMCMYVGITEPIPQGDDVRDYLGRAVNPVLIQGLTYLCKEKPEEPIVSVWGRGGGGGGGKKQEGCRADYVVSCLPEVRVRALLSRSHPAFKLSLSIHTYVHTNICSTWVHCG